MQTHRILLAALVTALAVGTLPATNAFAVASKCDSKITKAAGKKASCKAGVYAKAYAKDTAPDAAKLTKCEEKFDKICEKAKEAADCVVQSMPCSSVEDAVDICVADVVENACGGTEGGFCWFLGVIGDSCTTTCAAQGLVYDDATESYAGSGGDAANCNAVLDSLGVPAGSLFEGPCGSPIGCNVEFGRVRCTNAGAEGNTYFASERACACTSAP